LAVCGEWHSGYEAKLYDGKIGAVTPSFQFTPKTVMKKDRAEKILRQAGAQDISSSTEEKCVMDSAEVVLIWGPPRAGPFASGVGSNSANAVGNAENGPDRWRRTA
jgi:hypothetical protein